jgi:hypothetical protein
MSGVSLLLSVQKTMKMDMKAKATKDGKDCNMMIMGIFAVMSKEKCKQARSGSKRAIISGWFCGQRISDDQQEQDCW